MRILVLRALGLGDLLTAVPALRGLRAAFPRAEITLAAPEWLRDAVDRIEAVDRLLPTRELAPIAFDRPDLAVNLHGKGPQSVERLLATRPRELITYEGRDWPVGRHEVLRWCDLLQRNGIRCDQDDYRLRPVGDRADRIVIHPGASTGARRWPVERYAAVARALDSEVVVTAGPGERDLARWVARDPFSGTLAQLMDLVATARLVICADTGVAHVATAYGTPSVLLFGPVPPRLWGPRRGPHQVLWHGETGDTFADEPDPGLLRITVEEVLDAVGGVLCEQSESVSSARATSA
ncbi:glycosyltransferase family 9 protein [Lentzea nigeriaca]|uniref:glycosyltransferase family 9 protein n=1 Tax=Lentzea nigeriaca TaxID=1128665 RepID=UPI00195AE3AA|nr:glycosyltransferase family 9 protein [Lentzea nigeriaca]MBM7858797.1 ADP-heptose:LPS heptosyltransferase [Lentzea nigeriaca]